VSREEIRAAGSFTRREGAKVLACFGRPPVRRETKPTNDFCQTWVRIFM
jgi:hypothetical protein